MEDILLTTRHILDSLTFFMTQIQFHYKTALKTTDIFLDKRLFGDENTFLTDTKFLHQLAAA